MARGCWWVPRRAAFYFSALWVGSQIGAYALIAGYELSGSRFDYPLWQVIFGSPLLLLGDWFVLNLFVLVGALAFFCRLDALDWKGWTAFATTEALATIVAHIVEVKGPFAVSVSWAVWLALVGMMFTGVWFFRQWQMNEWAGEIGMLQAENASLLARRREKASLTENGKEALDEE